MVDSTVIGDERCIVGTAADPCRGPGSSDYRYREPIIAAIRSESRMARAIANMVKARNLRKCS